MSTALDSPRLIKLERGIHTGDDLALDRFWQEVAATGTPLVEELSDRDVRVTFLWRGAHEAGVALQSPIGGINPAENQLARLDGSDVWFRSYVVPASTRMQYEIGVARSAEGLERGWDAYAWQTDPLNPRQHLLPTDDEGTFQGYPVSLVVLPAAPVQPWVEPRDGVSAGAVELRRVAGPARGQERRIWLYRPAAADPAGLLVLFDGWTYANVIPTPTILDNLAADGRIPPIAALLVDNPDRRRELWLDEVFVRYVADDLVPMAREELGAPADLARTIVGGSSLGGVAGVFAALRRPDVFGNVLSQSGAFWLKGPGDDRYGWLAREVARLPLLPLRFYLDAGSLEGRSAADAPTQAETNRELRDALTAKGYPVHYTEFAGGHDHLCWRGTLADGLIALLA